MIPPQPKNIDHELIILESLSEYYKKSGKTHIRRAELKEVCDKRLYEKTDGGQVEYGGGTFESTLKKLEEKLAIHRKLNGPGKTMFVIDIKRIGSLLLYKRYEFLENDNTKIADQELSQDTLQKTIADMIDAILEEGIRIKFLSNLDDPLIQRSHQPLKEAAKNIGSHLASTQFDFIISHEDENFKLNEDAFAQLIKVVLLDIVRKSPKKRFKLLIEYTGLPYSGTKLGTVFMQTILRIIIPKHFVKWAKQVHNYEVPDKDIDTFKGVSVNFPNELNPKTREFFGDFFQSLKVYFDIWCETVDNKTTKK